MCNGIASFKGAKPEICGAVRRNRNALINHFMSPENKHCGYKMFLLF